MIDLLANGALAIFHEVETQHLCSWKPASAFGESTLKHCGYLQVESSVPILIARDKRASHYYLIPYVMRQVQQLPELPFWGNSLIDTLKAIGISYN